MLSDPRRGLIGALAVVAAALGWFAALVFAEDAIWARLGMSMHAVTFLAIFLALAGAAAAWIFMRFGQARADLLAGRDVLARWRVEAAQLAAFAPRALADEAADKRGALITIWVFLALIFGGFALADPEAAPAMLSAAAGVGVAVGLAYLIGRRVARRQLDFHGGEAIIGARGLMFNGVLHAWAVPLTRLNGARIVAQGPALVVAYRYLTRYGFQSVEAAVPFPASAREEATRAAARLNALARGGTD